LENLFYSFFVISSISSLKISLWEEKNMSGRKGKGGRAKGVMMRMVEKVAVIDMF
jgi:hypothetical protein